MIKIVFFFLLTYLLIFFLYSGVLNTYFSQDDFFHFKVSLTDGSITSFIKLFGFFPYDERGIAFYRPVFREIIYHLSYLIFGLNHLPLRIAQFIILYINIFLVFIFIKRFHSLKLAFFVSLFYGVSSVHVASLYYLAGGIQALGATTFVLLSLIFFHKALTENRNYYFLVFITFILALGSHELAIILPVLLILLALMVSPKKPLFFLGLISLITIIYLYLDFFVIGFSNEVQYKVIFSLYKTIHTYFWYTAWALGIPEMLIDFVNPGLKLNPDLMKYWANYYYIIFGLFFSLVLCFSVMLIKVIWRLNDKYFLFFLVWLIGGLLPVALLPQHKSTYYLETSLPAFWAILGLILINFFKQTRSILVFPIIPMLVVLTITSTKLQESTYWAARRGQSAFIIIRQIKTKFPSLPPNSIIYIKNDPSYPFIANEWGGSSKQISFILNGSDAVQLLYKDPTIKVLYEDLHSIPKPISVYEITVKLD